MGVAQFFVPEWDEIENKRDHRSIGCLGKQCKKMYSDTKKPPFYNKVIYPWTYPMLHKAKRWYVDFYILDPASNQMRRKKYMLSRYKTSKARIAMAREKIRWIVEEVQNGWNPFVKARTTREFTKWDTVFERYKDYLLVAGRKGLLKDMYCRLGCSSGFHLQLFKCLGGLDVLQFLRHLIKHTCQVLVGIAVVRNLFRQSQEAFLRIFFSLASARSLFHDSTFFLSSSRLRLACSALSSMTVVYFSVVAII